MIKKCFSLAVLLVILNGCASVINQSSMKMPGTDLGNFNSFYVEWHDGDGRNINVLIKNQLEQMGYEAVTGSEGTIPGNIEAKVTYKDRWVWDLSNYMIQLTIYIEEPNNGHILGVGKSYRSSLDRKSPEFMVEEVLTAIFQEDK